MMQALLSGHDSRISNIVHIGAGFGNDLQAYLESGARAVLLVEANPEAVAWLETMAVDHPGVTVVEAAVSANPEKRVFRHTNFPELNSFRAPTGLKELFPGLRTLSQDPVTPMDPAKLLEGLVLDGEGGNLLVLETPGESLGILQALEAAQLLTRFDAVRLREGRTRLYEGAATVTEIAAYLADLGFAPTLEPASQDPERPYLEARLDRALLALQDERDALNTALEKARADNRELAEQKAVMQQDAETLREHHDEAQRQAEERQAQLEALTAERDTLRVRVKELEQTLQASQADLWKADGQIELITELLLREVTF